jgi:glycosyltransferase involved in cell wall biosynthesis
MKLLSIVIPIYNGADKLTNCLNSIYQQGLDEETFEVLCVDDCSTDNTSKVIEEYALGHSNLIVLKNDINKNIGGARNTGIKAANGKYIMFFVDYDDESRISLHRFS